MNWSVHVSLTVRHSILPLGFSQVKKSGIQLLGRGERGLRTRSQLSSGIPGLQQGLF